MPSADIIPKMIGTRQATRADAVGTKNAKTAITTMVPMRRRLRLVPISEITPKARRLSSPVIAMAAAMTSDAAISATAGLVKPLNAADNAWRCRGDDRAARDRAQSQAKMPSRPSDDGTGRVIYRFRHPDDHRKGKNAEHVLAGNRQSRRLRQYDDCNERGRAGQQSPSLERIGSRLSLVRAWSDGRTSAASPCEGAICILCQGRLPSSPWRDLPRHRPIAERGRHEQRVDACAAGDDDAEYPPADPRSRYGSDRRLRRTSARGDDEALPRCAWRSASRESGRARIRRFEFPSCRCRRAPSSPHVRG